jgi:thiamine-phosphate diphosphorylase/hydroxyethylthiazole kinase
MVSRKTNTKDIIGTTGTREILKSISPQVHIRTVCIGGINASNVQRVLYQSSTPTKKLDGVAVVSAIVSAHDPKKASQDLLRLVQSPPPFAAASLKNTSKVSQAQDIVDAVPTIIKAVHDKTPLSHNMTNMVVQNFAANVALAVGGSPIMSNYGEEAIDLCKLGGSLVINMGTVTPDMLSNYILALQAYNLEGSPVVFDPVGAGATPHRRSAVKTLMDRGYFDVIKGNEGEICTVSGTFIQQKGVDTGPSSSTPVEKATIVRNLAARERNVVVMTGSTDYVSDGERTFTISNGHQLLGQITGSGCVLGTVISLMLAVSREDKLLAVIAALLQYEIAAQIAADREDVKGPGTFVPALIDELYNIQVATAGGELGWLHKARVAIAEVVDNESF